MKFLHDYIKQFRDEGTREKIELANFFSETKNEFDVFSSGDPNKAFESFVARYNWLGIKENKTKYNISRNLARNLPGALMQDYLLHLIVYLTRPYPHLDVFTEVKVPFGHYPLWEAGKVAIRTPSERSDLAIGYLIENGKIQIIEKEWPQQPYYRLNREQSVLPLVTVNSKIRVSQSEFFDWLGREELMTKGNPHCLSIQVALRKEMDLSIVEAAQSGDKFFLLGDGDVRNVIPKRRELNRLIEAVDEHLKERMENSD